MENGIVEERDIAESRRRRRRSRKEILSVVVMQIVQPGSRSSFVTTSIALIDIHVTFQSPVKADWAQSQQRS